jgi:replicative DNA helicase
VDDVELAEQAVVAGLMLDPDWGRRLAGWLRAADFRSPTCGLLFERLVGVRSAPDRVAADLADALRVRGELRRDGYPLSELLGWLDQLPPRPAVDSYGRLVVEAAVCRRVEAAGERLAQAAAGDPQTGLRCAHRIRADLSHCADRLDFLGITAPPVTLDAPRPALRLVVQDPSPPELATVGAVLLSPGRLRSIEWLGADDFRHHELGVAFRQIEALVRSERPVDRVTVTDALHRSGALSAARAAALLSAAERSVPVPEMATHYARQVLTDAVTRRVGETARQLTAAGRERRGGAALVVGQSLAQIDRTLRDQHRLTAAAALAPAARRAAGRREPADRDRLRTRSRAVTGRR